jgi:hypothetical protein
MSRFVFWATVVSLSVGMFRELWNGDWRWAVLFYTLNTIFFGLFLEEEK